ncbi:Adenosine 5 -monophosphoramidase [Hyphodiscus hymeniophilus]|uniref:Adenosine 5 -monophosphoramidase n=1 Tax=Hyphodiscus hymeniophilus TaxID=353542 RepID=A0A9P7AVH9_9HELO|nr:Adenosine 5 -monophosphoramidase [Hyphodiscus hymeniophilus]
MEEGFGPRGREEDRMADSNGRVADVQKPVVKKLVKATGAEDYNVLQNNGRIAHQVVDHVHFHMPDWRWETREEFDYGRSKARADKD